MSSREVVVQPPQNAASIDHRKAGRREATALSRARTGWR
jgi:hypothetical protein